MLSILAIKQQPICWVTSIHVMAAENSLYSARQSSTCLALSVISEEIKFSKVGFRVFFSLKIINDIVKIADCFEDVCFLHF